MQDRVLLTNVPNLLHGYMLPFFDLSLFITSVVGDFLREAKAFKKTEDGTERA